MIKIQGSVDPILYEKNWSVRRFVTIVVYGRPRQARGICMASQDKNIVEGKANKKHIGLDRIGKNYTIQSDNYNTIRSSYADPWM